MTRPLPRGWREDDRLQQELAALYLAVAGAPLAARACLSSRMGARTAGAFHPGPPARIALSARYLQLCSPLERRDLMLHELAHYHLWRQGLARSGHGPAFHELMRVWGFSRYPSAEVLGRLRPPDTRPLLLFVCPAGHEHWLRRPPGRRLLSCGVCSRRFDRRHLLRDTGVRRLPQEPARASRS